MIGRADIEESIKRRRYERLAATSSYPSGNFSGHLSRETLTSKRIRKDRWAPVSLRLLKNESSRLLPFALSQVFRPGEPAAGHHLLHRNGVNTADEYYVHCPHTCAVVISRTVDPDGPPQSRQRQRSPPVQLPSYPTPVLAASTPTESASQYTPERESIKDKQYTGTTHISHKSGSLRIYMGQAVSTGTRKWPILSASIGCTLPPHLLHIPDRSRPSTSSSRQYNGRLLVQPKFVLVLAASTRPNLSESPERESIKRQVYRTTHILHTSPKAAWA
ncbi:hypothetical protein TNIN_430301 [Trichonephila inaurata madagascariensis]|uniref:Uncharacterized protein n=1 Tax=Trichonephila inaurata madagascariensis TaxID=2747483 RepID=A0A8X6IXR7_9ARAC|nr:hypothetical protein TNIN_430301 [Trichonephila inaurata madagascariensis]